jgi:hypothetical protein
MRQSISGKKEKDFIKNVPDGTEKDPYPDKK